MNFIKHNKLFLLQYSFAFALAFLVVNGNVYEFCTYLGMRLGIQVGVLFLIVGVLIYAYLVFTAFIALTWILRQFPKR